MRKPAKETPIVDGKPLSHIQDQKRGEMWEGQKAKGEV